MSDLISVGTGFNTYEEQDKILVGISGGVNSSVCVNILQQQGFSVEGVVIDFSHEYENTVKMASEVAKKLGIPLHVENCHDLFSQSDCKCETEDIFKILLDVADRLGINYIATGHYAKVDTNDNGIYYIDKAESAECDQSYMLDKLSQNVLERLSLPLGEFLKEDINEMV